MNDIAALAGCARSTVYAVINDKKWVSEKTRSKVLDVIREYNWTPDRTASGLVSGTTNLVGLILKDVLNPFNSLLIEGVNSVLRESGFNSLLLSTLDDHEYEIRALAIAGSYRVEGIIITPQQVGVDFSHLWQIKEKGLPCVTFGNCPGIPFSYIQVNEASSVKKIVQYLSGLGHKRIGFLRGPETSLSAEERENGYRDGLLDEQLVFSPQFTVKGGATLREGYKGAMELFERFSGSRERPTAVICYNDLAAAGVYRAAADFGLSIPEDLSVTGFDDIELASVFGPPLTTIRQPCYDMGKWMAERVLSEIKMKRDGLSAEPVIFKFTGELVVRDSTAPPAAT